MKLTEMDIVPIGDFILRQIDIVPVMTPNGSFYHYAQVCTLLNRNQPELTKRLDQLYEAINSRDEVINNRDEEINNLRYELFHVTAELEELKLKHS